MRNGLWAVCVVLAGLVGLVAAPAEGAGAGVDGAGAGPDVRRTGAFRNPVDWAGGARPAYELTVRGVGLDGEPVVAEEWQDWRLDHFNFPAGVAVDLSDVATGEAVSVPVPAGTTLLHSLMASGEGGEDGDDPSDAVMQTHVLDISGDTTVTFDAREAEVVDVRPFAEGAEQRDVSASVYVHDAQGGIGFSAHDADTRLRTQATGPRLAEDAFRAGVGMSWLDGREEDVSYHAAYNWHGTFVTGLSDVLEREETARVVVPLGTPVPGVTGGFDAHARANYHYGRLSERELPATLTLHLAADFPWNFRLGLSGYARDEDAYGVVSSGYHTFEAGEAYEVPFNVGVFGPAAEDDGSDLYRVGDEIHSHIDLFGDGQGHLGWISELGGEGTTLRPEGGEPVSSPWPLPLGPEFHGLPPQPTRYELASTVTRQDGGAVSSEVSVRFGFESAYHPSESSWEAEPIPFSVVRFSPRLALDSTAEAGVATRVPVTVAGSAAGGNLASLAVEVSYDRGGSWRELPVVDGAVTVANPPSGGTVSFRAALADLDGNTTEQTILDAYLTR